MIDNRKFTIMKFVSRHKVLFGTLLLVWLIGMILTYLKHFDFCCAMNLFISVLLMGKNNQTVRQYQHALHPLLHPLQHNRLPPPFSFKMFKALRYCNPPSDISLGQEGRAPQNYSLKFVALVTRHGDRSPLRPIRNQTIIDCSVVMNSKLLRKYMTTMKGVQKRSKKRFPFTTFPIHPHEKLCSSSQMTIVGATQHLQLGSLLNKVYIGKYKLLNDDWSAEDLMVYSTVYSRTYQSAVAFLFAFLPGFDINKFKIIPSNDTRFCMSEEYCNCPLLDHLKQTLDKKTKMLIDSHPAVVRLLERLNPIVKMYPNQSDVTNPVVMFDSLMGYVCHNSHLPCVPRTHNCVTIDHVRNLIAFLDWQGRQFAEDGTHKKFSRLKAQGLLMNIGMHMNNILNKKGGHRFVLYSGHDVTLSPLISALGFDDGIIPPYASRLAFELYVSDTQPKDIIRIVFNGKDVTKYTPFCKRFYKSPASRSSSNICPMENFVKFINDDFYERMNASSFKAACDLSRISDIVQEFKYNPINDEQEN